MEKLVAHVIDAVKNAHAFAKDKFVRQVDNKSGEECNKSAFVVHMCWRYSKN